MHELDPALAPDVVFARLDQPVRRLVLTVHELYHGNWDDCAEDLRRRSAGRPYLFRLSQAPEDALGWLQKLKNYSQARGEPFPAAALSATTSGQQVEDQR